MPGHTYILGFDDGASYSSVNSFTIVVGASWGTVSLPITPLVFTRARLTGYYDIERHFPDRGRPNNQYCYDDIYSNLIFTDRRTFWGGPVINVNKRVHGINLGIESGGIFSAVENLIETVASQALRRILTALTGVGLDSLAATISTDSLIRGCNGIDTYNIPANTFSSERTNVCYIQAGVGCLVSSAISIMILGDFAPATDYLPLGERSYFGTPLHNMQDPLGITRYLADVYVNMKAYCIIGDAAAGLILPGASIAIIAS
jgi:hypothetical protein